MEALNRLGNAAFFTIKYGSIWYCLNKYGVSIKEVSSLNMMYIGSLMYELSFNINFYKTS